MALAHGVSTQSATWSTTTDPFTFTHAGGTSPAPVGVLVLIYHGDVSTDLITSVTYGGIALTRIATGVDTATEPGRVYAYFLGSGIPSGTQTVSVDHTATSTVKRATCITVTSTESAQTEAVVSAVIDGNTANPQIALDGGTKACLRYCAIMSGQPNVSDLTPLANMSTIDSYDAGAFVMRTDRQTSPSSGSFTLGYTAGTDDVAMVAIAIGEMIEWYGTINLIDKPRPGDNVTLNDVLSNISLITGATGTPTINVPDSVSLLDNRIVQLVSGGLIINRADSVALSDFAEAEPILPIFDLITLSDSAIVQRWMSTWYGTVNLIAKPRPVDVMTVIDGHVVTLSTVQILTISVGEALVNI